MAAGRPSSRNRSPVLGEVPITTGAGGAVPGVQRLEFERVGRAEVRLNKPGSAHNR